MACFVVNCELSVRKVNRLNHLGYGAGVQIPQHLFQDVQENAIIVVIFRYYFFYKIVKELCHI